MFVPLSWAYPDATSAASFSTCCRAASTRCATSACGIPPTARTPLGCATCCSSRPRRSPDHSRKQRCRRPTQSRPRRPPGRARTQDMPAVSPRTADLHPHPCSGTGHGTVIRRPLTRRRPIPPPRAPARHSTGLTFMPPMAVAMTRTTPTAIPNASRRTIIPRPNASHRRRQTVITTRATQRPG